MERLSKRFKEYCVEGQGFLYNPNFTVDELSHIIRLLDLEEQGLLLKLPCKVGDPVWDIDFGRPCRYEVTGFSFGNLNEDYCEDEVTVFNQIVVYYTNSNGSMTGRFAMSEIGKTVFLTREESALHMQGEITVNQDNHIKNDKERDC